MPSPTPNTFSSSSASKKRPVSALPSLAISSRRSLPHKNNSDSIHGNAQNHPANPTENNNRASGPILLADTLRSAVGRRDKKSTHTGFALATLNTLGLSIASDHELAAVHRGVELATVAEKRSAVSHTHTALLGDLVVFNGVVNTLPASLIGVVVSQRPSDGTIEFVYLARGVVRRGWVNPSKPNDKRTPTGLILNTFVRHSDGHDRAGTRYLAGQLFAYVVRLDRLLSH